MYSHAYGHQSGLKTGDVMVLKIQQMEVHRTGLRVSSLEFYFIICKSSY